MGKIKSKLYLSDRLSELPKAFHRFFKISKVDMQDVIAVLGAVKLGAFEDSIYLTSTYIEQITMKQFTKVPRYQLSDITAAYPESKGLLRDIVIVLGGSNTVKLSSYGSGDEAQRFCDLINEQRQKLISTPSQSSDTLTGGADEIKKYADLMAQGLISEEEYTAAKKKILGI